MFRLAAASLAAALLGALTVAWPASPPGPAPPAATAPAPDHEASSSHGPRSGRDLSDAALEEAARRLFAARAAALLPGVGPAAVESLYDTAVKYGRWALRREQGKIRYVQTWARLRGARITGTHVQLRFHGAVPEGDTAWLNLTQTLGLDYVYPGRTGAGLNRAGIGTRHTVQLVRRDGRWLIRRDWFTDPLGEDAVVPQVTPAAGRLSPAGNRTRRAAGGTSRYRRAAAVAYADRYCGAARGCGNAGRYNPRYRDYTGAGGDCTNFASQVLGDPAAGALPQDARWNADATGVGTRTWVHAESLLAYLLQSGRARLLGRGTFTEVSRPSPAHPRGAVRDLAGGDLIAYEERGRVEHMGVVVGTDSAGYPVVDSHTADRYHVPWDMGWDRSTVFWLVHLED